MVNLSKEILALSAVAAQLSEMAYNAVTGTRPFTHPDFDTISFYTDEPDQAIVAKKGDHCYLAFRGSTATLEDWWQNFNLFDAEIYKDNNERSRESCETRAGYADFLTTNFVDSVEADLMKCYESCQNKKDCLILTGHSQGGASAAIASIIFSSFNPTVITFGQPPAIDRGCSLIPDTRYYRFINSMQDGSEDDINFDPVVYLPSPISQSVHYGYPILLGDDGTSVKLLDDNFLPQPTDRIKVDAHDLSGQKGYVKRVESVLKNNNSKRSIPTDGFSTGAFCLPKYDELCATTSCGSSNVCDDAVTKLCVKGSCDNNDDCAGDYRCVQGACADGRAELHCPCYWNNQCKSGRCRWWKRVCRK